MREYKDLTFPQMLTGDWLKTSQRYLKCSDEEEIGKTVSRAKPQRAPRFGEISNNLSTLIRLVPNGSLASTVPQWSQIHIWEATG